MVDWLAQEQEGESLEDQEQEDLEMRCMDWSVRFRQKVNDFESYVNVHQRVIKIEEA